MDLEQYYDKDQKLTEQEIEKLVEAHETLYTHIDSILAKLRTVDKSAPYDCEDCMVDIDCCGVRLYWDETTGCCGDYETERRDYFIPIEYLWEDIDDMIAAKKEQLRKEKEEEARKIAASKAKLEETNTKREYAEFLRLKEKYNEK